MVQFDNAVKRFRSLILDELAASGITCWIAGGSVRDYFMAVNITPDFDIFFPSAIEYNLAVACLVLAGAELKWESDNGAKYVYNGRTFDLIKKYFASPEDTINAFDFTVSMFAVDANQVYHGPTSFIDLAKRQLMINKITYPKSTLNRAFKYYSKGFRICNGEQKKIIEALIENGTVQSVNNMVDNDLNENDVYSSFDNGYFAGID
jgi:hypothetical protein